MKKLLIILLCTTLLTGCGNNKKEEPKKEENNNNKQEVIETSPNVNFDSIDSQYRETLDEYLGYVPLRKINIFSKDAYSSDSLTVKDASNGLLSISSAIVYKKTDKEIKTCGEELEGCALCFDDNNCMLISDMIEKLELNYNKFVTPEQILNELNGKQGLEINYNNDVLKISKVLSFETEGDDLFIYEQAAFAYLNEDKVEVYLNSNKEGKILTINSNKLNSKEVIDEVLNNINKFNKYKHVFKTREQTSDFYYYWYSTGLLPRETKSSTEN